MAVLHVNFFSETLLRPVNITAIIPADAMMDGKKTVRHDKEKGYPTLYLLHGAAEGESTFLYQTRVARWAQERGLAVIMPAGENKFYVNHKKSRDLFLDFTGRELVEVTRRMFRLSTRREDTFIGGVSMGGYGAMTVGLQYSDTFGRICTLGGGFHLLELCEGTREDDFVLSSPMFLESVFGELKDFRGSQYDFETVAAELMEKRKVPPEIFMIVGTDDFLNQDNKRFRDFLIKNGYHVQFKEEPGAHNVDFWDTHFQTIMDWLISVVSSNL